MALDAGTRFLIEPAKELEFLLQQSLSYCENIPVRIIDHRFASVLNGADSEPRIRIPSSARRVWKKNLTLDEFVSSTRKDWRSWREFDRSLRQSGIWLPNSYVNPLYRLLLDNWIFRWYDYARISQKILEHGDAETISHFDHLPFNDIKLSTFLTFSKARNVYILAGPIFLATGRHVYSEQDEKNIYDDLARFVRGLDELWVSICKEEQGPRFHIVDRDASGLYSPEFIYRFCFLRHRGTSADAEARLLKIKSVFESLSVNLLRYYKNLPTHSILKIVAATIAVNDISSFARALITQAPQRLDSISHTTPVTRVVNGDFGVHTAKIEGLSRLSVGVEAVPSDNQLTPIEPTFNRIVDGAFTAWQLFLYESFVILRNWLNFQFGVFPNSMSRGRRRPRDAAGRRLARFILNLFVADEVTIYRVDYESAELPLVRFGAYSTDPLAEQKLEVMYKHMNSIIGDSVGRRASIAYRAMDHNKTQYCKFHDISSSKFVPPEQTMTYPQDTSWTTWGVSACAVPVRVNGLIWGVVELVSNRPDNFPLTVRSKIEELSTLLSSSFFMQSIIDIISEIANLILRSNLSTKQKGQELCRKLRAFFLCQTVALIRFSRDDEGKAEALVFAQAGREDLDQAERELKDNYEAYTRPFVKIGNEIRDLWSATIGSGEFDRFFGPIKDREFYKKNADEVLAVFNLSPSKSRSGQRRPSDGLLCITLPKQILRSERWESVYLFLARYVSTIIEILFSAESWDRELRVTTAHEMRRLARMLGQATPQLRKLLQDIPDGNDEGRTVLDGSVGVHNSLYDIEMAAKGIEVYSDMLRRGEMRPRVYEDPRIHAVRRILREFKQTDRPSPIDVREVFNASFRSRRADLRSQNLTIDLFPVAPYPLVILPEWCLLEVFSTLADNALKYTVKGTSIRTSVRQLGGAMHVIISNLGPELQMDDRARIFNQGFRGVYARRSRPGQGEGHGLWFARTIMRLLRGDLFYRYKAPDTEVPPLAGFKVVWHNFTVVFPLSSLVGRE